MIDLLRRVRRKVPNVALGVIIGLLVGGGAFAVAQTNKPEDAGVHGGPKPRFHDAGECNLVDVSRLEGNWTHGDYVSAVGKKDPSKVLEAAQSRCGKPTHAGKGPKDKPQKSNGDKEKGTSTAKPKPSPKPSAPAASPSPSPSPTVTASPEPTPEPSTPSPTPSGSSSIQGSL